MMSGRHPKATALAARMGVPERVVADAGHSAGRRMRDYGAFDYPASPKTALLMECGQHWDPASGDLAREATAKFLVATGTVGPALAEDFGAPTERQQSFTVVEAVTITSDSFTFADAFIGGEILPRAGTLIGHDGDREVRTPADNVMLVMPSLRLWKGQTAVRLAVLDG
jgi:hypothetical protein